MRRSCSGSTGAGRTRRCSRTAAPTAWTGSPTGAASSPTPPPSRAGTGGVTPPPPPERGPPPPRRPPPKKTAPPAVPRRYWRVDTTGRAEAVTLADEMTTIKDYGPARQLTLFEHDQPVLQVLTSDLAAPPAALLAWLRCRWRIENAFKYLTAHHGIDWLCHYGADTEPDTALIDNPARKQARTALTRAETTMADAQRALTRLLRSDRPVAEI